MSGLFFSRGLQSRVFAASGTFLAPKTGDYLCTLVGAGSGGTSTLGVLALANQYPLGMVGGNPGSRKVGTLALTAGVVYTVTVGVGSLGGTPPAGITNVLNILSAAGGDTTIADPTPTILLKAPGGVASQNIGVVQTTITPATVTVLNGVNGGGRGGGIGNLSVENTNVPGGSGTEAGAGGSGSTPLRTDGVGNVVDLAGNPGGNGADGSCVLIW